MQKSFGGLREPRGLQDGKISVCLEKARSILSCRMENITPGG